MESEALASGGGQWDKLRQLFFQRTHTEGKNDSLDRELVSLVLDHARQVVAHPARPLIVEKELFVREPMADLALEESLEENPMLSSPEDFLVDKVSEKPFSFVTMLDCSSSMSGEKHLLASVAVAVLLLKVPADRAGLVVFSSKAEAVKHMGNREHAESVILKFLKTSPRGFTNIAAGLKAGLKECGGKRRPIGVIATDGRATEGDDPITFAKQFDFLVVLHLHGPGSHLEASQSLAHAGHGMCLEVEEFRELPSRMYDAVRYLSRR